MIKKFYYAAPILFLGAIILMPFINFPLALAASINLKMATVYPAPDQPMSMAKSILLWQQEVTKRTKGDITFENNWGCALGPSSIYIELVSKGSVDLVQTFAWLTPGRFPIANYHYVFPFSPCDPLLIVKANNKMKERFPQIREDEKKQNVIGLCDPPGGAYDFMSRKPLKSIDDFKGEKVALVGRYFGRWLPPGATAVVRPSQDRYELYQTGVINIDFHPFTHFHFTKVYELVKNYTKVNAMAGFHSVIYMNLDVYNKIPAKYQKILREVGDYVDEKTATEILPQMWDLLQKDFEKAGVKFSNFPKEEIAKWVGKLEDIPVEWADEVTKKGYPGFEIVKAWQDITTDLGFKWDRKWGVKK